MIWNLCLSVSFRLFLDPNQFGLGPRAKFRTGRATDELQSANGQLQPPSPNCQAVSVKGKSFSASSEMWQPSSATINTKEQNSPRHAYRETRKSCANPANPTNPANHKSRGNRANDVNRAAHKLQAASRKAYRSW